MISKLSILIPTYNKICLGLVESLQAQASLLSDFHYEIIVADDGSTDNSTIEANNAINKLPNCQYREKHQYRQSCYPQFLGTRG